MFLTGIFIRNDCTKFMYQLNMWQLCNAMQKKKNTKNHDDTGQELIFKHQTMGVSQWSQWHGFWYQMDWFEYFRSLYKAPMSHEQESKAIVHGNRFWQTLKPFSSDLTHQHGISTHRSASHWMFCTIPYNLYRLFCVNPRTSTVSDVLKLFQQPQSLRSLVTCEYTNSFIYLFLYFQIYQARLYSPYRFSHHTVPH